uniref:Reverse transcriptase domain-containing protein n=1 Tax=Tanacetum cinerariifolium TaxID=118510 RepID=A0A6L2K1F3_TANCI|nr:reverse transcriptase domain-containing protein [Tanacetum cinerariifolium]
MADQRTIAELLRAPTEGYAEAIVVQRILAEQSKLKHSLINMMTSDHFFRLEKENPHDHIRWAARRWLEKEPPRSILTSEDLVSKFINELFPTSRTINLRNEISNFQQRFNESFHEAWDRYKDLRRACLDHGFTELHQLDTFYNALNSVNQDSLNSVAVAICWKDESVAIGGETLIIQMSTTACNTNFLNGSYGRWRWGCLKLFENSGHGGSHNTCLLIYCMNSSYQALIQQNQVVPLSELEKIKKMNEINMKSMQTQINNVKNDLRNEMKTSIQASMSNQTNELKNMMDSFFQMNTASTSGSGPLPRNTVANLKGKLKAITTPSGLVLDRPFIPMPPSFINPEENERVEETLTDPELGEYTIKVPPHLFQKAKPPS